MTTMQLAETAAVSLRNALNSEWFGTFERDDLAEGWRGDLKAAGLNPPASDVPSSYIQLIAFCDVIAGLRASVAA